ncbi:MAG: chloride channel protein, partial [Gemmatimonadetes bacterium]|nr:chloride channel protein [Gemmatimonadota bacterium]
MARRSLRLALQRSETWGPLAMAVAAGVVAGCGAIALRWMIRAVQWTFFDQGTALGDTFGLPVPAWAVTIAAPAVGMVIVVYLLHWWAEEAKGHGVAEVQFAVRMRGGRIRPRVAFAKAVSSAISIGSGGSVGREGPIVQIGASLGSALAQLVGLSPEQVKLMVAAGSAGAIAATFNAPVAGVLFALEGVLGSFAARSFGLVVVASVSATAVAQAVLGPEPAFRLVKPFLFVSNWELALYLVLGVVAGVLSVAFVRTVYGVEDWFDRWRSPMWVMAVAGGLVVGLMGTLGSDLPFGVGH